MIYEHIDSENQERLSIRPTCDNGLAIGLVDSGCWGFILLSQEQARDMMNRIRYYLEFGEIIGEVKT